MKNLSRLLLCASLLMPLLSYGFSSVAHVSDHTRETIYAAWNYLTQSEADKVALEGCRASARKNGVAALAGKCAIVQRQKGPGGGALVCGEDGCAYTSGYETQQKAVDAAYEVCARSYKDCQQTGITAWWDEAGYRKQPPKNAVEGKTCKPPAGKAVLSRTQCNNGACIRTFEDGCQIRFEAPYCHDPITGRWEWKPDGC